jgi:hypothetical protein
MENKSGIYWFKVMVRNGGKIVKHLFIVNEKKDIMQQEEEEEEEYILGLLS